MKIPGVLSTDNSRFRSAFILTTFPASSTTSEASSLMASTLAPALLWAILLFLVRLATWGRWCLNGGEVHPPLTAALGFSIRDCNAQCHQISTSISTMHKKQSLVTCCKLCIYERCFVDDAKSQSFFSSI